MNFMDFAALAEKMGSFGMMGWVLWYMFARYLPKRDEQHTAVLEQMSETFRHETQEGRRACEAREVKQLDAFSRQLQEHRENLTENTNKLSNAIDGLKGVVDGLSRMIERRT